MVRVLLVEDDEAVAEGVASLLGFEGFEVELVTRGRQAIGMIAYFKPDIIVLDVTLPDVSGIMVARAARDAWPNLPIIMSTGHDAYPGLPKLLALARVALLQKPYEIEALVATITSLLRS